MHGKGIIEFSSNWEAQTDKAPEVNPEPIQIEHSAVSQEELNAEGYPGVKGARGLH